MHEHENHHEQEAQFSNNFQQPDFRQHQGQDQQRKSAKIIEFQLSEVEFNTLSSHISTSSFKRYDQFFCDFLSLKLQEMKEAEFKCWLHFHSQYFTSKFLSSSYWIGRLKCKDPTCAMIYDVKISSMRKLSISYTGEAVHREACEKKHFFRRKCEKTLFRLVKTSLGKLVIISK